MHVITFQKLLRNFGSRSFCNSSNACSLFSITGVSCSVVPRENPALLYLDSYLPRGVLLLFLVVFVDSVGNTSISTIPIAAWHCFKISITFLCSRMIFRTIDIKEILFRNFTFIVRGILVLAMHNINGVSR